MSYQGIKNVPLGKFLDIGKKACVKDLTNVMSVLRLTFSGHMIPTVELYDNHQMVLLSLVCVHGIPCSGILQV